MNLFDLTGRSALVTGGGSGIGRALCHALADAGAAVVVADVDEESAVRVADELGHRGAHARPVVADVTDPTAVGNAVATAEGLGNFSVAVNNAGIAAERRPVADIDLADWHRVIEVDLTSVLVCLQAEIRAMRTTGGGSIVNVASMYGGIAIGGAAAYVAAKHGVVGLTRTAALDHAHEGIRVNAVGPGFVLTPLNEHRLSAERKQELSAGSPLGRMATPEEIAGLVVYLASDASSFATGGFHLVDGGYSIH